MYSEFFTKLQVKTESKINLHGGVLAECTNVLCPNNNYYTITYNPLILYSYLKLKEINFYFYYQKI